MRLERWRRGAEAGTLGRPGQALGREKHPSLPRVSAYREGAVARWQHARSVSTQGPDIVYAVQHPAHCTALPVHGRAVGEGQGESKQTRTRERLS
jgi:hypothetical protein